MSKVKGEISLCLKSLAPFLCFHRGRKICISELNEK